MVDYQWCFENSEEAAELINNLQHQVDQYKLLEVKRRCDTAQQIETLAGEKYKAIQRQLDLLIRERDELRAQVKRLWQALKYQLDDCINFDGHKLTDIIMEESSQVLKETPAQSLAAIQAAAIEEMARKCWPDNSVTHQTLNRIAADYADQIRNQAKEAEDV